ncbi:MAG: hypothetical protein ABW085_13015 [Sedimenticola sp.]
MLNTVLITGGRIRPGGFDLGDGRQYESANLLRLNLNTGDVELLIEKNKGNKNYPDEYPNLQFTAGCVHADDLWLSTDTEIINYSYPSLEEKRVISHSSFNNIHSVTYIDDLLWITSTGLDTVVVAEPQTGKIVELINAEEKPLWHRFSPEVDYRKVHSTRPHDCHPNYVFKYDGDYWVTRCKQEDAVCLSDNSKRINISGDNKTISVHDGIVWTDKVYFTSVDGCIVIADPKSHAVEETIDICKENNLNRMGWCRGMHIDADGFIYLGFSSIRKTRQTKKLAWLGNKVDEVLGKTACMVVYDSNKREIVRKYDIEHKYLDAIYSVLPEPGAS